MEKLGLECFFLNQCNEITREEIAIEGIDVSDDVPTYSLSRVECKMYLVTEEKSQIMISVCERPYVVALFNTLPLDDYSLTIERHAVHLSLPILFHLFLYLMIRILVYKK